MWVFQSFVDWCSQGLCQNGAECEQVANQYRCQCRPGWTGTLCDIQSVSCSTAAAILGQSFSPASLQAASHTGWSSDLESRQACNHTVQLSGQNSHWSAIWSDWSLISYLIRMVTDQSSDQNGHWSVIWSEWSLISHLIRMVTDQ